MCFYFLASYSKGRTWNCDIWWYFGSFKYLIVHKISNTDLINRGHKNFYKISQQPFKITACTLRLEILCQNVTKFYQITDAEHDCHQQQDLTQGRSFYAQTGSPVYQSEEASFPAFLSINSHI